VHEVLELASVEPGVQYCFYLQFLFTIDQERGWRGLLSSREGIGRVGLKQRDMEDGMKLAMAAKVYFVGMTRDGLEHRVGTEPAVVELGGGPARVDVAAQKPDKISR
jgi:hypothetical protein